MKVKKSNMFHLILSVLFTLLFSNVCYANAIEPITNFFTRDTIIPASILSILIIIIEAILLRWWIKSIQRFRLHLLRSTIINLVSSVAGSIIVLLFYSGNPIGITFPLLIRMFLLTFLVETPVIGMLYRRNGLNWVQVIKITFGINIISYLFVFGSQVLWVWSLFILYMLRG